MSRANFVSNASIFFPGLASEKQLYLLTPKNRTPKPPTAKNKHHHSNGHRCQKWTPSVHTPRRLIGKNVVETTGCFDLTISHEIGQRQQTRGGDERRRRRMREGDDSVRKVRKVEARGGPPLVYKR